MDKILETLKDHAHQDVLNDLSNFIKWLNYKNLSHNTIKAYINDIKQSLIFFANIHGEKIDHETLISLPKSTYLSLIALYSQKKAQKSQERLIATWKKWAKYKTQTKIEISFTNIKSPKLKHKLLANIEIETVTNLLNAQTKEPLTWQNSRNKTLILLLYSSGIRINEAISLKWEDIHNLTKEKSYAKIFGKGQKIRYVPIIPTVQQSLIEYKQLLKQTYPTLTPEYVFLSPKLKQWHACSVERYFRNLIKKNDLPKLTPHSLRHACATHLLKSGCNLKTVQQLLGHANLETTKHYIQHSTNELMDIHNKIIDKK